MRILAIEATISDASLEKFKLFLKVEAAMVWELYQADVVREFYFRQDRLEAVLILECENTGAAREVIGSLPLVREGLIDFDVIPLKADPGFSRLFTSQE